MEVTEDGTKVGPGKPSRGVSCGRLEPKRRRALVGSRIEVEFKKLSFLFDPRPGVKRSGCCSLRKDWFRSRS